VQLLLKTSQVTVQPNPLLSLFSSQYQHYDQTQNQFLPMATSSGTRCGGEGQTCACNGTVAYGFANTWLYQQATGSILCSGSQFGLLPYPSSCQCLQFQNTIQEDNINDVPQYRILASDLYGNLYPSFPSNAVSNFSATLTGDVFTSSNPIHYQFTRAVGPYLLFTIANADLSRYQEALYRTTPYLMNITYNSIYSRQFNVVLLGQGSADKDAEIEAPISPSLSLLSNITVTIVAG